jgi:hypothetical protein
MSTVYGLFDILALLYVFRSIQLSITIVRDWSNIRAEPLTSQKKALAEQAAFFIAVPISVFIHEGAHALAVWMSGGQVVEFQYRVFWGYVVPQGAFTAPQMWFIAIAGTLGSLLFGLALWLLTRHGSSSSIRYFGLRAFRFQVFFSLVYYPIFTLFGFDGDWKTIYDFGATPVLSAGTAVIHTGILVLFWRGDRLGWFEAPSHLTVAAQQAFDTLEAQAKAAPQNTALQLSYIDALRRGGADRAATHRLKLVLQENPEIAMAHLEMAALQSADQSQIPREAAESAAQALALGLQTSAQAAYAHELVGRYQFATDKTEEAVTSFTAALVALRNGVNGAEASAQRLQLLILRNQAYRRLGQYDFAFQDLQQALLEAQLLGSEGGVQQVEQELTVLNKHAHQEFSLTTAVSQEPRA